MKLPKIPNIITIIAVFFLMSVAGWMCQESGVLGNYPPETTKFIAQVMVIDENGTIVPDQAVYAITCLQKPAGWTSPVRYTDNDRGSATTDEYGFAEVASKNYTLTRGDVLWIGASTNRSLLESDLADKSFDSGRSGRWSRYNYSDVRFSKEMNITGYARSIDVRNSDGRMIDITWFFNQYNLSDRPVRAIEAFWYMDNHSWESGIKK